MIVKWNILTVLQSKEHASKISAHPPVDSVLKRISEPCNLNLLTISNLQIA